MPDKPCEALRRRTEVAVHPAGNAPGAYPYPQRGIHPEETLALGAFEIEYAQPYGNLVSVGNGVDALADVRRGTLVRYVGYYVPVPQLVLCHKIELFYGLFASQKVTLAHVVALGKHFLGDVSESGERLPYALVESFDFQKLTHGIGMCAI